MRKNKRSHKKNRKSVKFSRKFGLPNFPPKIDRNTSTGEQIGTVAGSLALRQAYLDDPEYGNIARDIKNSSIKQLRDDTVIKSIIKFMKKMGHDIKYNSIKKMLAYYNMLVMVTEDINQHRKN